MSAPDRSDPRRQASRDRVIAVLRELGPLSRAAIVEHTALSRATVSSVVGELKASGLVREDSQERVERGSQGRTATLVRLDAAAGIAVGVDFGKQHLRVAVADLGHRILAERAVELPRDQAAEESIAAASGLVCEVLAEARLSRDSIVGVGMGLPGPVDQNSGELGATTILPAWRGVRAAEAMAESLGLPVRVDNDANLGALGEWTWGAATGTRNSTYLKLATGIGAGLIIDGRLFRGSAGMAGEIGHVIIDPEGPLCRCGNRGCLEMLAGVPPLLDLVRPALGDVTFKDVIELTRAGNAGCRRVITDAGVMIGMAVGSLCNLVNPERVVVGGDLAATGQVLIDGLRTGLARAAIPPAAEIDVVTGVLGERAEVLGAVALALRESGLGFAHAATSARAA